MTAFEYILAAVIVVGIVGALACRRESVEAKRLKAVWRERDDLLKALRRK